jgi:DNA gyrase/topoisomerase IV subunit A
MGIIEGAIIGGAIGAAVSVAMLLKRGARKKKLIKALGGGAGREQARELLDVSLPPRDKIPLSKIFDQRERMAGLAMLDDSTAIEREIAEHQGTLTAEVQVKAMGLLGLAVRGDDTAPERLDELASRMESEGGRAMHIVKKKIRAMAHLAAGVAGTPIPTDQLMTVEGLAADGGMVQLLIWQALSMAMAQAGKNPQAEGFRNRVRQQTRAFEAAADAAQAAQQGEG